MYIRCIIVVLLSLNISATTLADQKYDGKYDYDYAALNNQCQVYDPYEGINRKIFKFNAVLDGFVLRPIAKVYDKTTNDYIKHRVGSFVSNISEPLSGVNYILQGNAEGVFKSFWRFAINSTFGIAGLFDIATKAGLTEKPQTFGNTLAYYGVGSGPYIVLPLYGGVVMRDIMDSIALNKALNPAAYFMHQDFQYIVDGTYIVHNRNEIMPFSDYVAKNSIDPYITIRDSIVSNRESKMTYPEGFQCPIVKKN